MQEEYEDHLDWFKSLPLYFETDTFRAVHACWDKTQIQYLRETLQNDRLTDELIYQSVQLGTPLNIAINETLKGKEIELPEGLFFTDKDGTHRSAIRIKWWEDPSHATYKSISVAPLDNLPDTRIDMSLFPHTGHYRSDDKAVFFGHYWLKGNPMLYRGNVCCLDYSVAKHGYLVAYRFDDEMMLENGKLVFV
jgi:hypothetical protein